MNFGPGIPHLKMENNIKENYILNTAYQILILIVPLITTPYVSRVLGADGVGIYSFTYSNMSYFLLVASLGSVTYGRREIAYLQDDRLDRSVKFWELVILKIITGAVSLIAYLFYLSRIHLYVEIAKIQIIYLIAEIFNIIWLFQGMEDFKRVVFRNTIVKIFNVVLLFTFVRHKSDVGVYTFILAGMTFIANISIWSYVHKYIDFVSLKSLHPLRNLKGEISLFLPTIAIQVYTYLDKSMIGIYDTSGTENGYYEQTDKIVRMALAIVTSLGTVLNPRIAKLFAKNRIKELKKYMKKSFQFTWFIVSPIFFGLIGITSVFVPVFYGSGFGKINTLLPLYSLLIVFVSISNLLGVQFLIPIGKENVYTLAVSLSAVANFLFNSIFIPKYLSIGATIASIIAEGLGAFILIFYCVHTRKLSFSDMYGKSTKYWTSGFIMFACILALKRILPNGLLSLVILIMSGGAVYSIMLFLTKDEMFIRTLSLIKNKILRKNI